jgi:hypothetical protein
LGIVRDVSSTLHGTDMPSRTKPAPEVALLAGGDRRLPRATVDADIPGLSLQYDDEGAWVVVPRQGVEALGRFLRGLPVVSARREPGILKAEGFMLLVHLLDGRRGSAPHGPAEIGFTGIQRADWDVGRSTRESLLAALETAQDGATMSILERMGLVAIDSKVRLKIV